ncbi:MAG: HesA/MoeB/ThiF family protein [Candidatus Methanomethylophilaceae archaeon]|nr:HesA/MoeB/ThiF family protein [Candidatus Methanomethylophilaceae archaeon]MBQ9689779.1 HesA/MoeB/ThiF family protein [Candidatus Methanomethylophilaceae archaeon]
MRFERQMPIFGEEGQQRIMSAVVGIIGCGGLGVNVITQLTAAGVSHFILCDHQSPELSNLNRQFIYSASDYRPKSVISAEWILALNPSAEVQSNAEPLTESNWDLFSGCDILVDCLDSFETRMIVSDMSEKMGIPMVHAGVSGFSGQIAVCVPGKTKSLREMIGTMKDPEGMIPTVGAGVSVVASMEALEVLKIISGIGTENEGKLITIDMKDWTTDKVQF